MELRDKTNPKNRITAQAALLQRDGDVANPLTNEAKLLFPNVAEGTYYVVLRPPQPSGCDDERPGCLIASLTVTDFSLTSFATSACQSPLGKRMPTALMWAGEANNDTNVIANGPGNDTNVVLGTVLMHPTNKLTNSNFRLNRYYNTDLNLDGTSLYSGPSNDINLLLGNVLLHPSNTTFAANFIAPGRLSKSGDEGIDD